MSISGCTAMSPPGSSPNSHHVTIYVATRGGVTISGTGRIDASIYAYNVDASGASFSSVTNSGNPTVNGSIIGYDVTLRGNAGAMRLGGGMPPNAINFYGY